MMKKEIVTKLIVRSLLGGLPDEEQKLLDKWLSEDVSHRELYQCLNDREHLASEYTRWEWTTAHILPHAPSPPVLT